MTPAMHLAAVTAVRQMLRRFGLFPLSALARTTLTQLNANVYSVPTVASLDGMDRWQFLVVDDRLPPRSPTRHSWRGTVVLSHDEDETVILGKAGYHATTPFQESHDAPAALEPYHIFDPEVEEGASYQRFLDLIDRLYAQPSGGTATPEHCMFWVRNRVLKRTLTNNPPIYGIQTVEKLCSTAWNHVTATPFLAGWELLDYVTIRRLFATIGSGSAFETRHSAEFVRECIGLSAPRPRNGERRFPESHWFEPLPPNTEPERPITADDLFGPEAPAPLPPIRRPSIFDSIGGRRGGRYQQTPRREEVGPTHHFVSVNGLSPPRFADLIDDIHEAITLSTLARIKNPELIAQGVAQLQHLARDGSLHVHCTDGRMISVSLGTPSARESSSTETANSSPNEVEYSRYLELDDEPEVPFEENRNDGRDRSEDADQSGGAAEEGGGQLRGVVPGESDAVDGSVGGEDGQGDAV